MAVTVTETDDKTSFNLALDSSNVTQSNFLQVCSCARQTKGASGQPIEVLITLGLDVDVWRVAADKMDVFAPVVITFLDEHNLAGMNFDWEDNVDTVLYMKLLSGLRHYFGKRFLITVAPGWPQYAWDASAIGVVDAFDMMSYSDPLEDLTSRVDLFTKTYKIPKSMLLGAIETEPHWQGDPGWNTDQSIVQKSKYAVAAKLQGMFSFRIDNDHGPWPVHPSRPTYHGANLMHATILNAFNSPGGIPKAFVLNTYMSLHDPYAPEMFANC